MTEDPSPDLVDAFANQQSSRHTRRAYVRDLRTLFGKTRVSPSIAGDIKPAEVDGLIRRGENDGLAVSTLRRRLSAIRGFYDWLTSEGIVEQNPARHGTVRTPMGRPATDTSKQTDGQPSRQTRSGNALTREQAKTLISAIDTSTASGRRTFAMIQLILHCALRRSEVIAINTNDFRLVGAYWVMDIYTPVSTAQPTLTDTSGGSSVSSAGFRRERVASGRAKVPDHVLGHVEAVRMDLGSSGGALFRSFSNQNRGTRITGDAVYRIIRSSGNKAGIDGLTPERLRHTGLHLAIRGGATVDQVRAHGRYRSVEPFAEESRREERLRDSAADYVRIGTNSDT